MRFLKNNDYRFNLEYMKKCYVNKNSKEDIFSVKIIDNNDSVELIDVNIRDMISSEGVEIEENKKKEIIKRVKEECFYIISMNDLFIEKDEIDIDDMVNDCLLSVLDTYIKSNK